MDTMETLQTPEPSGLPGATGASPGVRAPGAPEPVEDLERFVYSNGEQS